jgi:hypothetical protein
MASSVDYGHSKAVPMDVATRELIKSDLKHRFHMDIDTLKLLYLPEDEDTAWNNRVEAISKTFSTDPIICSSLAALAQIETMEDDDDDEKEREKLMYNPLVCPIPTLQNLTRTT